MTVSTLADSTAPNVSISAPAAGSTVSGTIQITAVATDDVAVAGVQFRVDGVAAGAEDGATPYSIAFDTSTLTPGSHQLTAVARDTSGNTAVSAPVSVTIQADTTAPKCAQRLANRHARVWHQSDDDRAQHQRSGDVPLFASRRTSRTTR